jgi:hypothetical protein
MTDQQCLETRTASVKNLKFKIFLPKFEIQNFLASTMSDIIPPTRLQKPIKPQKQTKPWKQGRPQKLDPFF